MGYFERIRDIVSEPASPEILRRRAEAGWQMVAIEWRRELPPGEAPSEGEFEVPYGLRISSDCMQLEADPVEHQVLMVIMEGVAMDASYEEIASRLNEQGYRMRNGGHWNRVTVFAMIPRLIDVGPSLFSSKEWVERSRHLQGPRLTADADQPATRPRA
ncbi:MAG TPA: recombinase family protein [Terracidiphilus sp.]|nr:recombinase family protein [Terracidiphilus sp.]